MMAHIYIWKDRHDGEMFQLGDKRKNGSFICWGQMHVDGVVDTFGNEVRTEVDKQLLMSVSHKQSEMPVRVDFKITAISGDPVAEGE